MENVQTWEKLVIYSSAEKNNREFSRWPWRFNDGHGGAVATTPWPHGNGKKHDWLISCHFFWGYAKKCCENYLVRCGRKSASVLWLLWDKRDALPQSSGIRSHNHPIISFGLYYCRIGNYVVDHGGPFPIARNTGMTERDTWHR